MLLAHNRCTSCNAHITPCYINTKPNKTRFSEKLQHLPLQKQQQENNFEKIKTKLTSDYNNLARLLSSTSPTTNKQHPLGKILQKLTTLRQLLKLFVQYISNNVRLQNSKQNA
jgi:hypothetical protein